MFDFKITVENIVMIGSFKEEINLCLANTKLEGSKGNRKRFPGLTYKLKNPKATFLLFKNGKFVCTGAKTKTKGQQAIVNFLELLKTLELVSNGCGFECCVKNIVASVNLGGASVALEQFTNEFESIYEPDRFPAAIYKTSKPKASFLVFLTGKLVCSGIADEEILKQTVKEFYDKLLEKKVLEKTHTT
ncbi:MAG: TATA-box-binding protein [Candidatus Bathyarchaeota archaeon]|nr:TATA-box-binding protein [Candidatus Termiticorpusculum sp.]